ncbi:unnamed protein product [Adineta steineri]|uniref:Fibronectin type-III domain-containing protein n=1 Tax=Adineta steineri TaxID=433720 RepID=A0A814FTN5_9BILA|nr:unnamed protein product [Adineta steineri]
MATEHEITMVTLGRPFHLGMLYDLRSDKLITGVNLWDPQVLANHTITHKQSNTSCEIITEDSLQHKAHALGVEDSLKLRLFSGLMDISGSAKYAEDCQKTNDEARLILKYSTTTHFQQLTMKHLGKDNLDHPDLLDTDIATHIVTGIVYGAEAFFIFDRTVSKGESKEEVSNSLKAIFNKSIFENEEEANLNLTDQEKKYVHKLHCKFYSDFHLNENPNTYDEAVKMYRQLPLLLENDPQLIDMDNYLHSKSKFKSLTTRKKHTPWFGNRHNMAKFHMNLQQFKEFAKTNKIDNTKIKFIINEEYSVNDTRTIELILYEHGSEKKGFIIPSRPDAPHAISVTDNNVTLIWSDAANGTEEVWNYKVMYQEHRGEILVDKNKSKKEEKWTGVYTKDNHKKIIISNLPPSTKFVFKVQSITTIGHSAISACSEPIETLAKKVEPTTTTTTTTTTSITTLTSTTTSTTTTTKEPKVNKWKQNAITVAGGNGQGHKLNQLNNPYGIFIDKNKDMFISDFHNHRIVKWQYNANEEQIIAGGNGKGNRVDQLNHPTDVIVDEQNHSIIITDFGNRRVIQWSNQNQQILIGNIHCRGLAIDKHGFLYVSNHKKNEVRRWKIGEYDNEGVVVAGGNGKGDRLNQLDYPTFIFVDEDQSVYVSDRDNHRVMKWRKDAKEGIVVAGGNGQGSNLNQLNGPKGVIVDELGHVYVADFWNDRVMRWYEEKEEGEIVVGENDQESQSKQLSGPTGLSFDDEENLYVADFSNHRIAKFEIIL